MPCWVLSLLTTLYTWKPSTCLSLPLHRPRPLPLPGQEDGNDVTTGLHSSFCLFSSSKVTQIMSSIPTARMGVNSLACTEHKVLLWHHPFYSLPSHCCFCVVASLLTSGPWHMLGFLKTADAPPLIDFKSKVTLSQRLPLAPCIKLACPTLPKRLYDGTADLVHSINH